MMRYSYLLLVAAAGLCACSAQQQQAAQRNTQVLASSAPSVFKHAYIVTAVAAKLAAVDVDATTAVHVAVRKGVVTLSGEAYSAGERARYVAAAKSVNGVAAVRDDLRVNSAMQGVRGRVSDAVLAARVSAAIAGQAGVNVFHVTPSVQKGIVTLRGTVGSAAVHHTILATVRRLAGVRGVVDRMTVHR